jgi:hypothetical protein
MIQKIFQQIKMVKSIRLGLSCILLIGMVGCGYGFQGSQSELLTKEGILTIYIAPIVNDSYKVGVENLVYNNIIRTIVSHRRVKVATSPNEADAILSGNVTGATYWGTAGALVSSLKPQDVAVTLPTKDYIVSTEYTAVLYCTFALNRRAPRPGQKPLIWTSSFTRSKPFPAANQVDVPGTTSALINESEFDRALFDLARSMMDDVHEAMLAMF